MTFFKLTADMAKEIRGIRLTSAEWRFWSYLVTLDPFGDRYVEMPDMLTIMTECGMSKATVYRAIAKLQEHNLFDFQAQIKFRNLKAEGAVSKMRQDSQICDSSLKNETRLSILRQAEAETTIYQDSGTPQNIQTFLDPTDNCSVAGGKGLNEEEEADKTVGEVAEPSVIANHSTPLPAQKEEIRIEPTIPNVDNSSASSLDVDEALKEEEVENKIEPTTEEVREVLQHLRAMGVTLNHTIRAIVRKHYASVNGAIAHIKERISQGEKFRNLEGAFVEAVKEGAKPENKKSLGGMPQEVNPPSIEQIAALEAARVAGKIRDYFLSSDGVCKVVMPNLHVQMPWWEYLNSTKSAGS
jgi:hypothetical protein